MYKISLLPDKYRLEREKSSQRLDLLIYFLFFTIICLILLSLATMVRFQRALELTQVNIDVNNLQSELDSLSEYSQKKDSVELVYNNISVLSSGLPSFPKVLPEILETVPNNINIESVSLEYAIKTTSTSMTITGSALDYADVAGWIVTLDALDDTGEILNSFATGKAAASAYNISFELEITILDASAVNDITWDLGE
jgi:Fimbrial assembly protein (PilN).